MTTEGRHPPRRARSRWRTRDILLAAIVGVVFGVVFFVWNGFYAGLGWVAPPFADSCSTECGWCP